MLRRIRDAITRSQPLWLAPDYPAGILWDDKGPIDFVGRSLPDDVDEAVAHDQGRALAQRVANELGRTVRYEDADFRPER